MLNGGIHLPPPLHLGLLIRGAHREQTAAGWQPPLRNGRPQPSASSPRSAAFCLLPSPGAGLSLTDRLQSLVTIPEQGKGAERQLPVQLPGIVRVSKGDTFPLVRQEAQSHLGRAGKAVGIVRQALERSGFSLDLPACRNSPTRLLPGRPESPPYSPERQYSEETEGTLI